MAQLIGAGRPRSALVSRCWFLHRGYCGSYRQAVTLFTEELDFLSDIDKTWMMGHGIAEWLGWPL